ncbi:MAG: DUF4832 domain-containing protein [Anaerolineae bacterium]|nr:DUF4832 domain-containing protein [Anaerolineae bacterium]
MSLKRVAVSALIVLCTAAGLSLASAQTFDVVTYQPSDANFPNPERGFYIQRAPLWRQSERIPLGPNDLAAARAQGISLIRTYYVLERYRDRPLDSAVFEALNADMNLLRANGFKVILRFAYNFPTNDDYESSVDAPLDIVLKHIQQLTPLLRAHADIIAHMEAGFIGAWGEWHSSSHQLIDYPERGVNAPAKAILFALLDALPPTRMIAVRHPLIKQQLFGESPLTASQAFSGSPQARIGAHEDCFLASATNWGTYLDANDEPQIAYFKAYLHADNRYVVQSGETCNSDEEAQPLITCENALADLAYLRWSSLNFDYHPDVIALWRRQSCFETIARHLGYRLRLIEAAAPREASRDGTLEVKLTVINDGFASPYNPRNVVLALRSADDALHALRLDSLPDPRFWLPNEPMVVTVRATLPNDLPAGRYELMLSLPDPEPRLSADPRYAIRLANQGLWDERTGFHALGLWIQVR